ncbi:MAG TPA: ABC-2 family transporter protein [Kofleriaceae bacterium]
MTKYLRLFRVQLGISVAQAMAYRANFLLEGVFGIANALLTLLPLIVVYAKADEFNNWTYPDALVVMAYFQALRAILEGVISPSLVDLVQNIRNGSFDYVLLKPVDAQMLVSAARYEPWKIFDLLFAIGLAVYAFMLRGYPPSVPDVVFGLALLASGAVAMYGLWIICAALAFWVGRLDNLMFLLGSIFDTARWPVAVFPGIWRLFFTFVIPVAVMTTFPAMAILGRLEPRQAVGTLVGAIALLAVSRVVWRAALRSYTSASS